MDAENSIIVLTVGEIPSRVEELEPFLFSVFVPSRQHTAVICGGKEFILGQPREFDSHEVFCAK